MPSFLRHRAMISNIHHKISVRQVRINWSKVQSFLLAEAGTIVYLNKEYVCLKQPTALIVGEANAYAITPDHQDTQLLYKTIQRMHENLCTRSVESNELIRPDSYRDNYLDLLEYLLAKYYKDDVPEWMLLEPMAKNKIDSEKIKAVYIDRHFQNILMLECSNKTFKYENFSHEELTYLHTLLDQEGKNLIFFGELEKLLKKKLCTLPEEFSKYE